MGFLLSALSVRNARRALVVPRDNAAEAALGQGVGVLTETRARDDRRQRGQADDVLDAFLLHQWKRLGQLVSGPTPV